MPGWIGHNIHLNVNDAIKANISLPFPCDSIASEVNSELSNISAKVRGGMGGLIEDLASQSQMAQVNALTSLGSNKTGTLASSISIEGGGNSARIGTDLEYASYVNDGRGSITAVGKALHFYVGGEEVFVKSVGPAAPRPYVDISGNMLEATMYDTVARYMESIL